MGRTGFAARTRERLREEVLAAAADEVLARGWPGLRLQAVAETVGVSRQTLYNEFHDKRSLARALVLHMAQDYLDRTRDILDAAAGPAEALRAAVTHTVQLFAADELFRTILSPGGDATFLPLYTSEGAPLVTLVLDEMTGLFRSRWPGLDPDRLALVLETAIRLVISHSVLPLHPTATVADDIMTLLGGHLDPGTTA